MMRPVVLAVDGEPAARSGIEVNQPRPQQEPRTRLWQVQLGGQQHVPLGDAGRRPAYPGRLSYW
jgi:hypothetical protein